MAMKWTGLTRAVGRGLADLVDGDEMRMVERRGGARLLDEARQPIRVADERFGQDLEGDLALSSTSSARYTSPMPPRPSSGPTR